MEHPVYFFYALMFGVAVPSIPFNRLAAIVFLNWAVGFWGISMFPHINEAAINVGVDLCGVLLGAKYANTTPRLITWAFFIPEAMVNLESILYAKTGYLGLHPYYAYWTLYWFASCQVLTIPFGNTRSTRMKIGNLEHFKRARRKVEAITKDLPIIHTQPHQPHQPHSPE